MFKKLKKADRAKAVELLTFIVQGTQGPAGHALVPTAAAQDIQKAEPGLIEIGVAAADGNVQVRATPAGIAAVASPTTPDTPSEPKPTVTFEIQSGIELPPTVRGTKGTQYPFDQLQVGQSFFIPATDKRPNPAKSIASTVASATKRYAKLDGNKQHIVVNGEKQYERRFVIRPRNEKDHKEVGARVWRSQ